ncbi:MAG: hypothetical protein ACRDID_14340 [Ktedonobacterales bacterium]
MSGYFYVLSPCPPDYALPFDALITAAWIILALLGFDLIVALGSLLAARSRGRAVVALALLLGAPIALGLLFSLQRQNLALCFGYGDLHYTPQLGLKIRSAYAQIMQSATSQAHTTFFAIVAIALLGALATLATLPGARRLLRRHAC